MPIQMKGPLGPRGKFLAVAFLVVWMIFFSIVLFAVKDKHGLGFVSFLSLLGCLGLFFAVILNPSINRWLESLDKK